MLEIARRDDEVVSLIRPAPPATFSREREKGKAAPVRKGSALDRTLRDRHQARPLPPLWGKRSV